MLRPYYHRARMDLRRTPDTGIMGVSAAMRISPSWRWIGEARERAAFLGAGDRRGFEKISEQRLEAIADIPREYQKKIDALGF